MDNFEQMCQVIVDDTIYTLGNHVVDAIRSDERDMILEMLRSEEWMYESCEDAADAIEQFMHYPPEEMH